MDEPEVYQLPNEENAVLPSRNNVGGYLAALVTAVLGVFAGLVALRRRREPVAVPAASGPPPEAPAEAPGEAQTEEQGGED